VRVQTTEQDRCQLGSEATVDADVTLGYNYDEEATPTVVGDRAIIRSGTTIYADVEIGDDFTTGHDVLIREETTVGGDATVGTKTVIDGATRVGSHVSLQTNVYVPSETIIGDNVFVGPCAVLTNDPYPVREDCELSGPTVQDGATVGANATLLPDVTVGENAFVAAGAVVTEDVPPSTLAVGAPAEIRPLPESLVGGNTLITDD